MQLHTFSCLAPRRCAAQSIHACHGRKSTVEELKRDVYPHSDGLFDLVNVDAPKTDAYAHGTGPLRV